MPDSRSRAWLAALVAVLLLGLALRGREAFNRIEEGRVALLDYYTLALNLHQRSILAYPLDPEIPTAFRAGLFPAFLAGLMQLASSTRPEFLMLVQIGLAGGMIVLCFAAAGAVHSLEAGIIAATMYALHPEQIRYAPNLNVELFFSVLLMAVALSLIEWTRGPRRAGVMRLGLAMGLSIACRSVLWLFPLALGVAGHLRRELRPHAARHAVLAGLVAVVPLAPWIARNAAQFGAFIPFEKCAAVSNLYSGSIGMIDTWNQIELQAVASLQNRPLSGHGSVAEKSDTLVSMALESILSHPSGYLRSCLARLKRVILDTHPWLALAAAIGVWRMWSNSAVYGLGLLVAYFWGVHSLMSIEIRYFVPLTPILMILAGCGLADFLPARSRSHPLDLRPVRIGLTVLLLIGGIAVGAETILLAREVRSWDARPYPSACREGYLPAGSAERSSWRFFNDRGVRSYLRGDLSGAVSDFQRAANMAPDEPECRLSLATAKSKLGDHESALALCREALSLPSSSGYSFQLAGWDCMESELNALGRIAEARDAGNRAKRLRLDFVARGRQPGRLKDRYIAQ